MRCAIGIFLGLLWAGGSTLAVDFADGCDDPRVGDLGYPYAGYEVVVTLIGERVDDLRPAVDARVSKEFSNVGLRPAEPSDLDAVLFGGAGDARLPGRIEFEIEVEPLRWSNGKATGTCVSHVALSVLSPAEDAGRSPHQLFARSELLISECESLRGEWGDEVTRFLRAYVAEVESAREQRRARSRAACANRVSKRLSQVDARLGERD